MDSTLNNVVTIAAKLLEEHNCQETVILDLTGRCSWTDGFIIATVNSRGHLKGVLKHLLETLEGLRVPVYRQPKNIEEDGWTLVDCGDFVVHLMDKENREFYELEKLWYFGDKVDFR